SGGDKTQGKATAEIAENTEKVLLCALCALCGCFLCALCPLGVLAAAAGCPGGGTRQRPDRSHRLLGVNRHGGLALPDDDAAQGRLRERAAQRRRAEGRRRVGS